MAVGYPEKMRDATGKIATYTEPPHTGRRGALPKHPHPDAILRVHDSGHGIHPCTHRRNSIQEYLDWCATEGVEPDRPISGDETTRLAAWQCWDDIIGRTRAKSYTGTEPCEEPRCPHPQPHASGSWMHQSPWEPDRDPTWGTPYFRDIAHVLYPHGVLPIPIRDEPEPPAAPEPEQLDMLAYLEEMTA